MLYLASAGEAETKHLCKAPAVRSQPQVSGEEAPGQCLAMDPKRFCAGVDF